MKPFMIDDELVNIGIKFVQFDLASLFLDVGVLKLIIVGDFGMEVMNCIQRTHPQDLKICPFVIHQYSVIRLEIEMNKTSLFSFLLLDFKVFLLPTFTDPAYAFIINLLVSTVGVNVLDYVD